MATNSLPLIGKHHAVLTQLGGGEPETALEAAAFLEDIRTSKGYLDEETTSELEKVSPRVRDKMLLMAHQRREMEAAFTTSISEQIYSSKYRFLYELIQNADDSAYCVAHGASVQPFLRFEVSPETVMVETNEDGFTRANIEAICATGKSSKKTSAADNHIGEKGFGFKSVFAIADEVHIQSGIWSFRFEHSEGDDGIGMVTPLDAEPANLPADVTTRITLRLTQTTENEYQKLLDAFNGMPETTIFFLQRLQKVHVRVTALDGAVRDSIFEKQAVDASVSRIQITRQDSEDTPVTDTSLFRCVEHVVDNMPKDKRRKGRKSASVKLAFPVDPDTHQPKLSKLGQHAFAYLPLQRLQNIQFLIHSDFITSASRESVVQCPWNDTILKGVAEAFGTAVQSWANEDDPLRYSWLDYLPTDHMDGQWGALLSLIQANLADRPILQTWESKQFKQPGKLCILEEYMLHEGEPILEDLQDEIYLAPEYIPCYASKLFPLGVSKVDMNAILERLQADLHDRSRYRLFMTEPNDKWHEAFAGLFLTWELSSPEKSVLLTKLEGLLMIPLWLHSQWAYVRLQDRHGRDDIYFSHTGGVAIPDSLGLYLLDTHASLNPTRKRFYKMLGVKECSQELVIAKIKEKHLLPEAPSDSNSHILYLFRANEDPSSVRKWAFVKTDAGDFVKNSEKLYFPSEGAYDMYQLSKRMARKNLERLRDTAVFLNKSLVTLASGCTNEQNVMWEYWLQQATGARRYPPLLRTTADGKKTTLSPAFLAICTYTPSKFLGMLRAHWSDYQKEASLVKGDLMGRKVKTISQSSQPLRATYLPTEAVLSGVRELGLPATDFPILHLDIPPSLPATLDETNQRKWRFLEEFGVRFQPDLAFYKHALQKTKSLPDTPRFEQVIMVYVSMAKCTTASDKEDLLAFFSEKLIFDPLRSTWLDISQCIWHGPSFMRYKTVIATHYGNEPLLKSFFTATLELQDIQISDIFFELRCRRIAFVPSMSTNVAGEMYAFLNANMSADKTWAAAKKLFEDEALVLGRDNTWHKLDTCVWQSPFRLSGKEDLSSIYPGLEDFFVKCLKVKKVKSHMLINEIAKMVEKENPDYAEVKERLLGIGMILARSSLDQAAKDALEELALLKFLPMRLSDESTVLVDKDAAYAISDHARYANAWAGKGVLLDFTVEEVQILNAVFSYLALDHRYLSAMVTERSAVGDEMQEDTGLSRQLQNKAYALYCCAAKHKSPKALRGDHRLLEQLSTAKIVRADLSTELLLNFEEPDVENDPDITPSSVKSERASLHHEIVEGCLKVYVPKDQQQFRTCFRSQLPRLLGDFVGIDYTAHHDISVIISSDPRDLDDVLTEHDIPCVSWIERPTLDLGDDVSGVESDETLVNQATSLSTPTTPTPRRPRHSIDSAISVTPDHSAPRDDRSQNQRQRDQYIGALAEAAVFETFSALELQDFSLDNWKSTIHGCLSHYARYAGLRDWVGVETADIVYTDRDGVLSKWLRENCTGDFPPQIPRDHDFSARPIEYFVEVKGTTGPCDGRFYLSAGQYERMQAMTLRGGELPDKVYVIVRAYNVRPGSLHDEPDTLEYGLKAFVDPLRLNGRFLRLESQGWTGWTL
ncbi:hypothetical protein DDE83_007182 [Stemphylium lycopersici]|uniref:Protein NO VEIN C-terminal domain-containing protein n=1 Tax=Stemphylium lycopersici TaxID=183478 RepID=A0A364MWS8_STELY|nr:hypothetical protein DDE83_007182 [Stemphylium lycopersici]